MAALHNVVVKIIDNDEHVDEQLLLLVPTSALRAFPQLLQRLCDRLTRSSHHRKACRCRSIFLRTDGYHSGQHAFELMDEDRLLYPS